MLGDSTTRQVWASFVSGFQGRTVNRQISIRSTIMLNLSNYVTFSLHACHNFELAANGFERNAKEWTRENVSYTMIVPQ
jgi:hypothetical protein